MKVRVILNENELRQAVRIGSERNIASLVNAYQQPKEQTQKEGHWEWHITGAIGEFAVSKVLNVEWHCDTKQIQEFDCGRYQVRSTTLNDGRLLVRRRDNPEHVFIFAQVIKNRVLFHGWASGQRVIDLDQEIFPNCFTIPTYLLYPMTDLPEFPQILPDGVDMFKPPVKKLGGLS